MRLAIFKRLSLPGRSNRASTQIAGANIAQQNRTLEITLGRVDTLQSSDVMTLQKILTEVQTRQIPQPQTTVIEYSPPMRGTGAHHILWSALCVTSTIAAVFVVKYLDAQKIAPKSPDTASRSLERLTRTLADENQTFAVLNRSLQQLAEAVSASTGHAVAVGKMLEHFNNSFNQTSPAKATQSPPSPVAKTSAPREPRRAPELAEPIQNPVSTVNPATGHVHPPLDWALVPRNVVVHHDGAGVMDYWQVPRIVSGIPATVRVIPIAQNNLGTYVHHIAEVKDYLITPSGDWIEIPASGGTRNR
jgi:hypothetical protein